jgi:hypothetical protein
VSKAHFLVGAAQALAQKSQVKPLPTVFREPSHVEWQQHWRSCRVAVYSRSGFENKFFLFKVEIVRQAEEMDYLIASSHSLDDLITRATKWENDHPR